MTSRSIAQAYQNIHSGSYGLSERNTWNEITALYNTRLQDEWKLARKQGTTPWGMFARNAGLQEDFIPKYLEQETMFKSIADINNRMLKLLKRRPKNVKEPIYQWREVADIIIHSFNRMAPEFGEIIRRAFAERWIHAAATGKKRPGARTYMHNQATVTETDHPYVIIGGGVNPDGTVTMDGLTTLGHELAHTVCEYYKMHEKTRYPTETVLGETMGNFAGLLVLHTSYVKFRNRPTERVELHVKLQKYLADIYYQLGSTGFEHALYKHYENDNAAPLERKDLEEIYTREMLKYGTPADKINSAQLKNLHHIFSKRGYYLFSYKIATLIAVQILKLLETKDGAQKWTAAMRDSPSATFGTAMQKMGFSTDLGNMCSYMINFMKSSYTQLEKELAEERWSRSWLGRTKEKISRLLRLA